MTKTILALASSSLFGHHGISNQFTLKERCLRCCHVKSLCLPFNQELFKKMEKHSEIPFANQEFEPVLNQSRVEQHMLENAKDSLKTTMAWKTKGKTFTRKLSTLRFASGNFHEHLKRVFVLEEHDGYMHFVLENCPHFQERVSDLRREHDQIRGSLDAVTAKLDRLAPVDAVGLEEIEHEIASILDKYEHHNRKETSLIQDSLLIDNGCGD